MSGHLLASYLHVRYGVGLLLILSSRYSYDLQFENKFSAPRFLFLCKRKLHITIKVLGSKIRTQTIKSYYNEKTFYDSFNRCNLFVELFV